jgi:ABC-type nitrate/sulfonate/bicarbonate transport system ATPase subunit
MGYKAQETILYVDKLSVGYKDGHGKDKTILKDVTIIEKDIVRDGHESTGQTVAFIGRSGRGKSTLFKALTGLLKPTTGQVLITDFSTEDKTDAKQVSEGDIGFVDQKYTLFRHKTVYQICQYALRKSKLTKPEKEALITEYLTEWGLMEHKDKYSCELSGGQRQRTAIIEQMLTSKHFMILDEPFSGLDVGNIEKVKQSFAKILSADEYNTIIFSTHDIRLAVELADSIYIVGFPEGVTDYSTIVKHYDLKAMGLAWEPYGNGHRQVVTEIKELLLKS